MAPLSAGEAGCVESKVAALADTIPIPAVLRYWRHTPDTLEACRLSARAIGEMYHVTLLLM